MKKPVILAVAVAFALLLLRAAPGHAQTRPAPSGVAIIDLSYIFKNYGKFQDMTANMKRSVEAAETDLKGRRDELQKLADKVNTLPLGGQERNNLETELTQRQANLQVQVTEQKKLFLRQEAKIYYTVYQEVIDEIKFYSERNGLQLVLRFNGDPIDPNNPQEVMQDLNKSVVWYSPQIDITPIILDTLTTRWNGGRGAARAPVNGATRPTAPNQGVPQRQR